MAEGSVLAVVEPDGVAVGVGDAGEVTDGRFVHRYCHLEALGLTLLGKLVQILRRESDGSASSLSLGFRIDVAGIVDGKGRVPCVELSSFRILVVTV